MKSFNNTVKNELNKGTVQLIGLGQNPKTGEKIDIVAKTIKGITHFSFCGL